MEATLITRIIHPKDDIPLQCFPEEIFDEEPHEDLRCPIGLKTMNDPVIDKCGHSFCTFCIQSWLCFKNKCPYTNLHMQVRSLESNKVLKERADKLSVKCIHKDKGCQWKGKLEKLRKHIDDTCEFVRVKCRFSTCDDFILRKDISQHETICPKRVLMCKTCKKVSTECTVSTCDILKRQLGDEKMIIFDPTRKMVLQLTKNRLFWGVFEEWYLIKDNPTGYWNSEGSFLHDNGCFVNVDDSEWNEMHGDKFYSKFLQIDCGTTEIKDIIDYLDF